MVSKGASVPKKRSKSLRQVYEGAGSGLTLIPQEVWEEYWAKMQKGKANQSTKNQNLYDKDVKKH